MQYFEEHNNTLRLATSYISICVLTSGEIYCNHLIWVVLKESVFEIGVGRDPLIVAIKQDSLLYRK